MKRIFLWLLAGLVYDLVVGRHFREAPEAGRPIITFVWGCWGLWPLTWLYQGLRKYAKG